jgi:hypothetical protein
MYVFIHYLPFRKQTRMKSVPPAMTEGSSCVCGAEGARRGGRTDLETLNVLSATKTLSRSVQTALTYSRKLSRRAVPVKSNSYISVCVCASAYHNVYATIYSTYIYIFDILYNIPVLTVL